MKFYKFGNGTADGDASMAAVLGGKGANLAEMCKLGINFRPGLTIPVEACLEYMKLPSDSQTEFMTELMKLVMEHVKEVESQFDYMPLFSVRSGAPVSMPGMMDTILNVG